MKQPIFLKNLRLIAMMTHSYFKCCNAFLLIYRRWKEHKKYYCGIIGPAFTLV